MFRRCAIGCAALYLCVVSLSFAWSAETLKIGDKAPNWSDLKGTDDKAYSLDDFKDRDAVVIVFTCNSCPFAKFYESRLIAFAKEYCGEGKPAALVAINANKIKEDLPDEMKKRAKEQSFNFPYLCDETQATARAYDAHWTPEFYVFDKERKLVYRGKMDDHTDAKEAKQNYVVEAVKAVLAGETPKIQEMGAIGCAVRYERKPREKK